VAPNQREGPQAQRLCICMPLWILQQEPFKWRAETEQEHTIGFRIDYECQPLSTAINARLLLSLPT
jgi:hypothetical protein